MADARILIVEDEGIEALDLQHRLTGLGYAAPDIVATGEEAVVKAGETRPDLIVMDIMLRGEMDGVTAAGQIHDRFDIPVIFITAYADDDTLRRAKITEPYGYLVKPFKEKDLYISIDMALYKHKMERKLKESEKWFATALSSIGDAVIATDKNGLITFMNPVAEGLTGWKTEDAISKKLTEVFNIINRDTRKTAENPIVRVLREGVTVGLANHTILIARDGRELPIDDSAAPIRNDRGNIIGLVLVFRDVTEREKAEEVQGRLSAIVASAEDAIISKDLDGVILTWNLGAELIFGYKAEEVMGKNVSLLVPPGYEDEVPAILRRLSQGEHIENYETVRMRKDGTLIPVSLNFSAIKDGSGRVIGSSKIAHNITERKQAEEEVRKTRDELAAANKELEAFSYSVSHDLRAPLRTISGFIKILIEDYAERLDAVGRDYLTRVYNGSVKMNKLIEDLLYLSRISRQEVNRMGFNISNKASSLIANCRQASPERNVDVRIREDLAAFADPGLMDIVLANLFDNAWKFTSKTENARIEFGAFEQGGKTVYYVRDNGAGFDPAYKEKLFWPFQRLHLYKEFEGTGIGLTNVERIIRRHGGKVWAEGAVGKGATFYFTL